VIESRNEEKLRFLSKNYDKNDTWNYLVCGRCIYSFSDCLQQVFSLCAVQWKRDLEKNSRKTFYFSSNRPTVLYPAHKLSWDVSKKNGFSLFLINCLDCNYLSRGRKGTIISLFDNLSSISRTIIIITQNSQRETFSAARTNKKEKCTFFSSFTRVIIYGSSAQNLKISVDGKRVWAEFPRSFDFSCEINFSSHGT